jgi:hypothetical protein
MIQKFIKKCEEFVLCGGYGEANGIFTDGFPDNNAIYHIITKGSVKMGRPFEPNYISLDADSNNFVDVKDYLYSQRVYTSSSSYHMFGFNAIDPKQMWDGKIVKDSFDGDDKSWLICFKGKPIINNKEINPMDYAKLDFKHYDVVLNDAVIGLFTKL